jgi:carboxymethylenebutenolidase
METYRSGDATIRIDLHEPAQPGSFPALLVLHGSGGAVSYWLERFAPMLAQSGYAVYAPHYFDKTGTQRATAEMILDGVHFTQWLAAVRDSFRYVAERPCVDSHRIGVIGISLGGYLATALAIEEPPVRAVIELSGGVPRGWEERMSPKTAPMLVIHGEDDQIVPVSEARRLHQLLEQHGVVNSVEILPGETHWFSQSAHIKLLMRCSQFLSKHL